MGQDSESAAEFVMTVRTEHVAMKTWYNNDNSDATRHLKEKYGSYPSMWKEVLNWPGWKEARREYMKHSQTNGGDSKPEESNGAVPRKRKSRWGSAPSDSSNNDGDAKRRSRWGNNGAGGGVPGGNASSAVPLPGILPSANQLPPEQQEEMKKLQSRLRSVNEKLDNLDQEAARVDALPRGHRERSPSPPPVYGPDGKRKNTRAVRWRERYTSERQDILEKLLHLNPNTRKSSNVLFRKRTKKIRIPVEDHPNYNFIGLIIGPRGKTQKELESKTGCKIAIRGRGSVKEGARGRRDGQVMQGDNDPLHVVITGDDQASVDAASSMIEQMLVVIDDEKNVHKQQQLRELALLNGTLKEDEFCPICAEKGHRAFECPRNIRKEGKGPVVKCAICGDTSHPTRDCRQKPGVVGTSNGNEAKNQEELDSDYLSFMAEIEGKKVEKPTSTGPNDRNLPPPPPSGGVHPPGGHPNLAPPPGAPPAGLPPPPPPAGLPPPPPVPLPPLAGGLPPLPHGAQGLPPPPPPSAALPPQQQHNNNYYDHRGQHQANNQNNYQHQQGYGGGYQQQHYQQGQQQQQYQQHGYQQQQPHQVRPGEETTAWDPNAYYGSGGTGGLNWWEQ